jgi:hypothetical protein
MLLKPVAQKLKEILDSSMRSSRRAIIPGRLPVELWYRSAAVSSRVFALVFCKILFGKNILYCDTDYSVSIFCMVCE